MMTCSGRQMPGHREALRARLLGCAATAAVMLMLGGCSMSPDLLSDADLKSTQTASNETTADGQSELQKATIYWGQQYAKKPAELQPALNYARDLKAMGEKRKAMAVLQQASLLHDGDKDLASEYGRLALDLDQVTIASQALSIADDPAKPDWRVISARGTVFAKQGKYGDAIPYYERALELSSNNPAVMNNLAMAHAMMGDPKKAETILRQAANSPDATPKVKENLALVLSLQGRYDESKSIASAVGSAGGGASDVDYLKQMVKAPAVAAPQSLPWTATSTASAAQPGAAVTLASAKTDGAEPQAGVWKTSVSSSAATPKTKSASSD